MHIAFTKSIAIENNFSRIDLNGKLTSPSQWIVDGCTAECLFDLY